LMSFPSAQNLIHDHPPHQAITHMLQMGHSAKA